MINKDSFELVGIRFRLFNLLFSFLLISKSLSRLSSDFIPVVLVYSQKGTLETDRDFGSMNGHSCSKLKTNALQH